MKNRNIFSFINILMLSIASIFMNACTPEGEADSIAPISKSQEVICNNCLENPLDLIQRIDNNLTPVVLGTVQVCVVNDELCFRFAAAGGTIGSIGIGIFGSLQTIEEQNNNPAPKSFNFDIEHTNPRPTIYTKCIPLTDIADALGYNDITSLQSKTIFITAKSQISGGGGTSGGHGWAGILVENGQYPFDRYFPFTLGCDGPPVSNDCLFTQGYWLAKPNVIWPGCNVDNYKDCGSVTFAGHTYTREQARAIFRSTNKNGGKTDAKQAWLQAIALKLSLDNNPSLGGTSGVIAGLDAGSTCYGVLASLAAIESYFTTLPNNIKQTAETLNNNKTKSSVLRSNADKISSCLTTHREICDNISN